MAGRILVVEDDASLARSIVNGLSDEGFHVAHAADGDAALAAVRAEEWDLLILDWWLPGRDGLAVLDGYRREGGNAPVLFVTAHDAVSDRVRGLDGGADDYLCKPFAFEELLARARALIRRGRPVEVTTLSYRDVRVDLASQRAERAGHPLDLTAKELAVLVFFFRHADEVLSRARIYAARLGRGVRLRLQHAGRPHQLAATRAGGEGAAADPYGTRPWLRARRSGLSVGRG